MVQPINNELSLDKKILYFEQKLCIKVGPDIEFFLASFLNFLYNRKSEKRYGMSKKDKKIEIQLTDATVLVGQEKFEGYTLTIAN